MVNKVSKIQARVNDKNRLSLDEVSKPPENTFWTDAHEHYEKSVAAISQVESTVRDILVDFVKDPVRVSQVKDDETLATNINTLTRDIGEHVGRLNNIYAKHSDKTGSTKTPDEHMKLLSIHGDYAEALEIYQANIIPTVAYILEQVGAADALVNSLALVPNVSPEADAAVVTDVVVKQVTESNHE